MLTELSKSYKEHVDLIAMLEQSNDKWDQYDQLREQKKYIKSQLLDLLDDAYQSRDDRTHELILSVLKYNGNNSMTSW